MPPYPRGRMTLFLQCETEASTLEGYDQYCPMESTKSDYRSPRETPRHFQGPGVHLIMIMGLLLPAFMTAKVEDESLAGPKITASILTKNATDAGVVPKTAFSSKLRMSILVGLEGSGHHYLLNAVDDMFLTNEEISVDTTPCITTGPYLTLSSMKSSPLHYTEMLKRARGDMHDLALREESLPRMGHLVRLCSEMSYPTGLGENKVLNYIDLRLLAEIAEEEGVDLRVIYLRRSAHDILMADTVHRHFEKFIGLDPNTTSSSNRFSVYSLILLTDAAVMHSFIAEIDPAFIVCHDYRHAGEEEQVSRIANFVAPNPVIAEMYKKSLFKRWNKRRDSETEELPFEEAEVIADRLQQKLNVFESPLCG